MRTFFDGHYLTEIFLVDIFLLTLFGGHFLADICPQVILPYGYLSVGKNLADNCSLFINLKNPQGQLLNWTYGLVFIFG